MDPVMANNLASLAVTLLFIAPFVTVGAVIVAAFRCRECGGWKWCKETEYHSVGPWKRVPFTYVKCARCRQYHHWVWMRDWYQ
jgi:hypothetical protein